MTLFLPQEVDFILKILKQNGYEAYAVGGCVRDSVLKREPKDWDITTIASPEIILKLFSHTIPTGLKHGTVTVLINKKPFEVTTYRIDGEYSDNRHPDKVIFTDSLSEDLSRRDFTINAMAYNDFSGLKDPFDGLKDLGNKLIKCVGDPNKRFNEDALRMLRAIRFSGQLNFNIDETTFQAIKINCALINNVSPERIKEELCKILLCKSPSIPLMSLKESGLMKFILPEIMDSVDFDQRNPHHDKDVFVHTLSVINYSPPQLPLRLAALFHDIGKPASFTLDERGIGHFYGHEIISTQIAEKALRRLKFDNASIKKTLILVKEHMSRFKKLSDSSLKKFMTRVGTDNLEELFQLQEADIKASAPPQDLSPVNYLRERAKKIVEEKQPLSIKDLAVNGSDLIRLGLKPGKSIGDMLNHLLGIVMENPSLNSKDILLEHINEALKKQN